MQIRPGEKSNRLGGKVAIVTGAGSSGPGVGTGKAMSILFARHGARVLLVDIDPKHAEETRVQIEGEGGQASVLRADVSLEPDCRDMVSAALDRYGALDVLVNNVAILSRGTVVDIAPDEWDRVMSVNLKSMMLASRFAVPAMARGGGGSIINIASNEGFRGQDWAPLIAYSTSKGGAIALTASMAVQHGRQNVRVNCIAPGMIYTPLVAPLVSEEVRDLRRRGAPLGVEGDAWDVAWAAVFLASDEARWVSGVVLPVDGGLLATQALSMVRYLRDPG